MVFSQEFSNRLMDRLMDQNSNHWGVGLLIGIVIGIFIGASFGPSQSEYEAALRQCEVVRDDYVAALEDANRTVREANYQLAEGQSYAWSSCEDMGNFLENLYEVGRDRRSRNYLLLTFTDETYKLNLI